MNREEIKKKWKKKELVEIGNKGISSTEKMIVSPTKQVISPTNTTVNWNNVINRANQILSNTRNVNNLVSMQNPLLNQQTVSQRNNNLKDFSNTQRKFNENDAKNKTNKDKNILSKGKDYVGEIGRSLSFGIVEPFANIASMAYNFPTKLGNALGLETVQQRNAKIGKSISPEEFTNTVKEIENLENERTSQLGTGLRTASRWSRVIGNMIPSILMGQGLAVGNTAEALQKSASAISSFTSALNSGSSTYNETLNEEQDNFLKAGLKAGLYGFATKKIEGITGGNIINKFGSLDDVATKGISKVAKNELQKKILSSVYGAFGETVEENIENWTDHLIDYAFGDAKDITAKSLLDEAKQTSIDTTAVNFIMQLLGMGGATYNDVKLYEAEQKIDSANFLNENQKYAMKEILQENGNPNVADYLLDRQLQKTQQNQATTMQNNEISQQEQQTISNQDKTTQNQTSQEIKQQSINSKFKEGIDQFKSGKYKQSDNIEVVSELPQYFYNLGFETNQPLYLNMNKLNDVMKVPKGTINGKNQHGITMDIVEALPEAINNPLNVIRNPKFNDRYVIVTSLTDQYGDIVIVPVKINHENAEIQGISKINSIYGKENYDFAKKEDLESYMEQNKDNIVYDIDNERSSSSNYRLQLPSETNTAPSVDTVDNVSTSTNIIPQNNNNMQQKNVKNGLPQKPKLLKAEESKEDLINIFKEETKKLDFFTTDDQLKAIQELDTKELDKKLPDTSTMIVNKLKKEKTTFKEFTKQLRKYLTNKGVAVDNLFKVTGNKQGIWKYDRYLGSFAEGQTSIGVRQINSKGEVVGDSLLEIYGNAKKDGITQKILDNYVLNKDNIARSNYEKGIFGESITSKDSQRIIEEYDKKYPKLKEYAKQVSDYANNNTKGYLVGNFISEDLYNKLREMYPDHVPVVRDITETPGMKEYDNVGTQVLKKAKGGDQNVLSTKEALAQQSINYTKAFRRNEALKEVYKSIKSDTKDLYDLGEIIDIDQANMVIKDSIAYDEKLKKYTATIFEDGKAKVFEISKDIYDAFTENKYIKAFEDTIDKLVIGKVLKGATSTFKSLTTGKNILYALKNMSRDTNDASINSTTNFANYYVDWVYAYEQIKTNGKYWQEFVNAGGSSNTFYDYNKGLLKKEDVRLPRKILREINRQTIGRVEEINQVVEIAPRLAEYIATRQRGGSIDEALYNSAEITTNFKRGGEISKLIDKYGVPYFNSSIQGLSKLYRNVVDRKGFGQYANLAISATLAGIAPSIINHLIYEDDEEYKELPDYLKDGYYLIKVDDIPKGMQDLLSKFTENNFVRIPKGRISAVLGGTAVRMHKTLSQEGEDVWNNYLTNVVLNNIGINNPITNNIFSGMIQGSTNEAWYGGNIYSETKYDGKLPVEITDEKTDEFSNWVANTVYDMAVAIGGEDYYKKLVKENSLFKIMATPKLLHYVIDQYSGFVGDFVLPMLTPFAENNAFIDQFTTSSTLKSSTTSKFYDIINNCYPNSEYATDTDKLTYKYLTGISKEISDLYKAKSEIQSDASLTNREKQSQTYDIQEQINTKMEEAISNVEGLKLNKNSAEFIGKEYYKDTEGKWITVSDEDKIEGISTETYATYRNELTKATEKKRKEENDEEATLDKKEKVAIINNSKYTAEEKKAMYEKSYGNQDTTFKYLNKITDINIDAYLDYISEEIKADDDPNSNIKGKTISGSKKKKLKAYLDNPDNGLSYIERLYIYGRSYGLDRNERQIITNAVKKAGLTSKEQKEFYLTLHDVEEREDGQIKWK